MNDLTPAERLDLEQNLPTMASGSEMHLAVVKDISHTTLLNYNTSVGKLAEEGFFAKLTGSGACAIVELKQEDKPHGGEAVFKQLDPESTTLVVKGMCPSATQWRMLGRHLPNIRNVLVDTGFDEAWTNTEFPEHWKLDLLVIGCACAELIRIPQLTTGQVKHLIFLMASGLRFEGPDNKELIMKFGKDVEGGTKSMVHDTHRINGITAIPIMPLAHEWFNSNYLHCPTIFGFRRREPQPRLTTLEIIENDAIDIFERLFLPRPENIYFVERLVIRHKGGSRTDLRLINTDGILSLLLSLPNLKELDITIGSEDWYARNLGTFVDDLLDSFPPNLEVLNFRAPARMTEGSGFTKWIQSFGNPDYLPKLRRLSFILDITPGKQQPRIQVLYRAKVACRKLLQAAHARGVEIEEPKDVWGDAIPDLGRIDSRWKGIDADVEI